MAKTILTCAVTGGGPIGKHPAIPVTPKEIAEAAIGAAKAGATIAHIHVREPKTGQGSMELAYYREVVERIRDSGIDVLINLTTGPGALFVPSKDDPGMPGPGTNMCHRRGAGAACAGAQARHLQPRSVHHVEPHARLHERAGDPRPRWRG